jgi:hypothetical protein
MTRANSQPILALSVRQPWSELIISGRKTIEIRSWSTDYRGLIWIHVPKQSDSKADQAFGMLGSYRGGYIGGVILTAVVPLSRERWELWKKRHMDLGEYRGGLFAWMISDPYRFAQAIPGPGQLGLFQPEDRLASLLGAAESRRPVAVPAATSDTIVEGHQ